MSASTPDDDACVCKVCRFAWGVSPEATVHETVEDLQARAGELSIAIFRHWILLNKTLKRYQNTIQKRWTKKNNTQRLSVLLTAWPSMAATHRPDFAQLRDISTKGCRGRVDRTKEREANLFPYINREDLVHCPNLLMFLNSRGRHLPHKFAFGDRTSAHISVNTPSSTCDDINQRRMVLYGKRTPRSYGELSTFKVGDDTDMLGMHPITGLLVLEIQERILRFLVTCCRLILHDLDLNKIDSEPTQKPTSIVTASASTFRTVTALANEAPYRLPQRLDLARLCMLVEAKRSEVEEHLWSLREDPRYFALQLQDWAEHNGTMVPDKNGNRHVSVGKKSFWNRVCKSLIIHAYRSLVFFDEMFEQLVDLQKLMIRYKKNVHPTKRLPLRLEESFQRLDKLVDEMRHGPLNDLALGLAASPPLRSGFERSCKDKMPSFHDLIVKHKSGSAWRIHVLFRTLLSEDQHDRHGLVNIVGEIQRTLDEGSVESQDITSWVSSRVSDLALIVEVKHQLELFQPWYTMWRHHSQPLLLDMGYDSIEFINDTIYSTVDCVDLEADRTRFVYPSEKRRTKATVARMRESEKALDSLWEVIDQHCNCHTGHVLSELLIDFFKERDRKIQRTPAWVEPKKGSESRPVQQAEQEWILRYFYDRNFTRMRR